LILHLIIALFHENLEIGDASMLWGSTVFHTREKPDGQVIKAQQSQVIAIANE
jgi:hypothetical protein